MALSRDDQRKKVALGPDGLPVPEAPQPPPVEPPAADTIPAVGKMAAPTGPAQTTQITPTPGAVPVPPPPPPNPNPGFTPPGGYGTNTAAPQANGDPAAPAGFFDAYHAMVANAAKAKAGGPVPNGSTGAPQYRDFSTGQDLTQAEGEKRAAAIAAQDQENSLTNVPNLIRSAADLAPGTTIGDPNSSDPVLSGRQFWESTGVPLDANGQPVQKTPALPAITLPGNGPAAPSAPLSALPGPSSAQPVERADVRDPAAASQLNGREAVARAENIAENARLPVVGSAITKAGGGTGSGVTSISSSSDPSKAAVTTYGPENDLRDKQINPTSNARTDALGGLVSDAAMAVGKGKSRGEISQGYLDAFDEAAQPKIRDQMRAVGQNAAKFGRLGMGDTAVETLNPYTDYLTQRAAYAKQLAGDSAAGDISDRLNNLGALNATQGQAYGQDASGRNELRTERGFQQDMNQTAIQNALMQWITQEQAKNSQFGRDQSTALLKLQAAAQQQGMSADSMQLLMKMFGDYMSGHPPKPS